MLLSFFYFIRHKMAIAIDLCQGCNYHQNINAIEGLKSGKSKSRFDGSLRKEEFFMPTRVACDITAEFCRGILWIDVGTLWIGCGNFVDRCWYLVD